MAGQSVENSIVQIVYVKRNEEFQNASNQQFKCIEKLSIKIQRIRISNQSKYHSNKYSLANGFICILK